MRKSIFLVIALTACSTNPHQEMNKSFTELNAAHSTLKSDHIRLKNEHETLKSEHMVINENIDPNNMFKFPKHDEWVKNHTEQAALHDAIISELTALEETHKSGNISVEQMKLDHEMMKTKIDALNTEHDSWVSAHAIMSEEHRKAIETLKTN